MSVNAATCLLWVVCSAGAAAPQEPLPMLTLGQAVQVLNSSPWARQETFTRVISGIGSGVSGEKEIFNTFYVRVISAMPVRRALARLQQIQYGYEGLPTDVRLRFDEYTEADLLSGFGDWIVVAVSFRSNDPNEESNVRRFFQKQTAETLKNKAFLSTDQFSQVPIRTYFAPRDDGIGAKFVFPRWVDGSPIVSQKSKSMAFELLDVPAASPRLRARFPVTDMIIGGQKPAEAQVQTSPLNDPSLAKIDLLQIDLSTRVEGLQYKGSKPIQEVMNPFTARKRSRIYGSVYEYHRNDNFDARNFFDPVGRKLPEYKRNQFGGSFGVKATQRLTLFGTYDGLRINQGSTLLSHVPTPSMKQGDFSSLGRPLLNPWTGKPYPNNLIPQSMLHPAAMKVLVTIPDPNRSDPDRNFVNNLPIITDRDSYTGRVDYQLGEDSKIFANYTLRNGKGFQVAPLPAFGMTSHSREQNASVNFVRDIGPNLVASLKVSFDREAQTELSPQAGSQGLLASLGIAGLAPLDALDEGYPDFSMAGYASLGSGESPTASYVNEYGLEFSLTWVRKNHEFEYGMEIKKEQINNDRTGGVRRGSFEFDGYYTGDAFAEFLLGIPAAAERGVGSDRADVRRTSVVAYAGDTWKVSRELSLNGAFGYEYAPFGHSIRDNVYTFTPLLFEPPATGRIVRIGSEEAARSGLGGLPAGHAVFPDRNDWGVMFGLAISPLGNNRLVLRGSYERVHESRDLDESFEVLGRSYPVYFTEKAESSEDEPALSLNSPFNSATPVELRIYGAEPRMRNSEVQYWRFAVQNEIVSGWNMELAYSGNKTSHASRFILANVPLPGPGLIQSRRPNPSYGRFSILTSGGSYYGHAFYASLSKNLSRGLSFETNWGWDRAFTYGGSSEPSNPRDLRAEKGPNNLPRHAVSLTYIWDLPLGRERAFPMTWAGKWRSLFEGWRISGITSMQSGGYFTPRMAGDPNNDGVRADRPDRLASGVLPSSQRSIDRWFATEAFAGPPAYGFGNCGRNILTGPSKHKWDISFLKRTQVSREGNMLELRVQLFNAFNHANFSIPSAIVGTSVFGKIFGADRAREIEIALKYTF